MVEMLKQGTSHVAIGKQAPASSPDFKCSRNWAQDVFEPSRVTTGNHDRKVNKLSAPGSSDAIELIKARRCARCGACPCLLQQANFALTCLSSLPCQSSQYFLSTYAKYHQRLETLEGGRFGGQFSGLGTNYSAPSNLAYIARHKLEELVTLPKLKSTGPLGEKAHTGKQMIEALQTEAKIQPSQFHFPP
eukprot:1133646-Pelagomonas_calceolata.AAC.3